MSAAGLGYACALVLAVVLAVAAMAKMRDLGGTESSFRALGLPRAATMARVVPAAEAGTAAVLVLVPALGGFLALGLLAFFTTFLVNRLRAGVYAPCSCFGALPHEPLSPANLVGNGFLMLLALGALAAPAPVLPALGDLLVLVVAALAEIVIHALVRRASTGTHDPRGPARHSSDVVSP